MKTIVIAVPDDEANYLGMKLDDKGKGHDLFLPIRNNRCLLNELKVWVRLACELQHAAVVERGADRRMNKPTISTTSRISRTNRLCEILLNVSAKSMHAQK